MTIAHERLEIDSGKVREAQTHADFSENAWLTFYLAGQSNDLDALSVALEKFGARNLEGSKGGFVNAKIPVSLTESDIIDRVDQVRKQADRFNISIDIVDLDPTDESHSKKFYTLWKASQ
ncbi:hypothetical protein [Parasphingorhabdus sp.]|uniref:hypothetical protein n=1 Tax=Parasphingorhabdus sp. TaxID=2709688 RepID=UPI00300283B8